MVYMLKCDNVSKLVLDAELHIEKDIECKTWRTVALEF